jgi:phage shock protein PspC (stress-responsive transcriptional regulator)
MQKVIGINLNGNAYQFEEGGYEVLQDYLARAERELKENPDRAEIMADLEQAIADKCQKYLGPHKSVVTAAEAAQIVAEMGPVSSGTSPESGGQNGEGAKRGAGAASVPPPPKRLYRIPDGAMIAGVCTGLAAYFQIDVALIRIGFVVLTLLTKGVGILVYVVMMFLVPEANTPEERAAAGGMPFNAKEVVDRVMRQAEAGSRRWTREWRRKQRQWRRAGWSSAAAVPPPSWAVVVVSLFGLVHLALFLIAAGMLVSLVNTGAVFYWQVPPDVPLWAAVLVLFIAYQIVVSPFRAAHHWVWHRGSQPAAAWLGLWHMVIWLVGLGIIVWVATNNIPEIGEFILRLPQLFRDFMYAVRDFLRE